MNIRLSLAGIVLPALIAGGSLAGLPATPALALPNSVSCSFTTYYNDAHHDQVVGHAARCGNGRVVKSGTSTAYYTTTTTSTPLGSSGGMPNDGQLPCEFLKADCSPIPGSRFGSVYLHKPPVRSGKPVVIGKSGVIRSR
jgi:hypothetical protein